MRHRGRAHEILQTLSRVIQLARGESRARQRHTRGWREFRCASERGQHGALQYDGEPLERRLHRHSGECEDLGAGAAQGPPRGRHAQSSVVCRFGSKSNWCSPVSLRSADAIFVFPASAGTCEGESEELSPDFQPPPRGGPHRFFFMREHGSTICANSAGREAPFVHGGIEPLMRTSAPPAPSPAGR